MGPGRKQQNKWDDRMGLWNQWISARETVFLIFLNKASIPLWTQLRCYSNGVFHHLMQHVWCNIWKKKKTKQNTRQQNPSPDVVTRRCDMSHWFFFFSGVFLTGSTGGQTAKPVGPFRVILHSANPKHRLPSPPLPSPPPPPPSSPPSACSRPALAPSHTHAACPVGWDQQARSPCTPDR